MSAPARTSLRTHEVSNQPTVFAGRNLFTTDPAMVAAATREAGAWAVPRFEALGAAVGSGKVLEWGELANRHVPELVTFDRYGGRIDEVRFHPAYHHLMSLATEHRLHDIAWARDIEGSGGSHAAHAVLLALFSQAEAGVMCPMSMTYAAVAPLAAQPGIAQEWAAKAVGGRYDAPLRPIARKAGITIGMAMTEKQGGSDVRANTTVATPEGGRGPGLAYTLRGHKWFCSAPMSDGFVTLAYAPGGLSCFLVPRVDPDGGRNAIELMRLKDKLGNRSNASSEIEYHDARAILIGEEGRGVPTIIDMVHGTRLDTVAGSVGIMRMALALAHHHVSHRRAFQKTLIDQPAMTAVIADLQIEYEAAVVLAMRIARAFDGDTAEERSFARLSVAVGKYWLNKRVANFVYECMECLGGAGYVEESGLPRLYREAPLNSIWEGSGNVVALDVLRTLAKDAAARATFLAELHLARGADASLDRGIAALDDDLTGPVEERDARRIVERMALALQGALLVRHAPVAVADAFCASRFGDDRGVTFGVLPSGVDTLVIVERVTGASA